MSLKLSICKGRCSLTYPEERPRQYYASRRETFPEQDICQILFKNTTVERATRILASYRTRRPLLSIYSSIEELIIETKTSDDMSKCISLMTELFEGFSTFATNEGVPIVLNVKERNKIMLWMNFSFVSST